MSAPMMSIDEMVDALRALVEVESPSSDIEALNRAAKEVAALGQAMLGVEPEWITVDDHPHLRWRFGDSTRVVLIGHFDTVFPMGALAARPFTHRDGRITGPGCFDMKAGIVQGFAAVATLADRDGVTILLTSDEELGSLSSRQLIEDTAAGAAAALVLEPSAPGGTLKIGRKGTSMYRVEVVGRAAHAGLEPEKGANALVELAHVVLAMEALARPELGTTVTPTVASCGTATNVVPDRAVLDVDVRASTPDEQQRVDVDMHRLTATVPGTELIVTGGPNRPPLDLTASADLFELARRHAEVEGVTVGGGSDGNFTAGIGVPTLDGLGPVGDGAHAVHEYVVVAEMPKRAALVAALIDDVRNS